MDKAVPRHQLLRWPMVLHRGRFGNIWQKLPPASSKYQHLSVEHPSYGGSTKKTWLLGFLAWSAMGSLSAIVKTYRKQTRFLIFVHDTTNRTNLTSGWYKRFLQRHPDMKTLKAQTLSKPRNAVDKSAVEAFYWELSQSISLVDMDPSRVFNLDETSFSPTKSSRKVDVQRTSKDVFVEEAPASAHVTIVACVSVTGTKIPPLFVLPEDRVSTEACDSLTISGAAIMTSEKGWTNSLMCRKWMSMVSASIPSFVARSVLLIFDGCSKLLQVHLRRCHAIGDFAAILTSQREPSIPAPGCDSFPTLQHQQAEGNQDRVLRLGSRYKSSSNYQWLFVQWVVSPVVGQDAVSAVDFKPAEVDDEAVQASWLQRIDLVRTQLLLLPPEKKQKNVTRKTLTVSGKFITAEYHELLQAQSAAKPKRKKKADQVAAVEMDNEVNIVEVVEI
ncbi:hypothetical protein AaE_013232 [Aphanomyces astaci]|uniref:DDE-1 domain-containing protein n=1 Tax=Aphanomyces astaci TaxID=112090 RepID=A0A6A4Z662_APHAT|nr:hypothetical protein AaE_013232 [Aphanomyces astaci]